MLARFGVVLAVSLLLVQSAYAQPAPAGAGAAAYGTKGRMEAEGGLHLGYPLMSNNNGDYDIMFVGGFRYFVMDGLAVGGQLRVGYWGGPGGTLFQFVPGVEYNFKTGGNITPYVGAGLGFDYFSISQTVCFFGTCSTVSGSTTAFLLDFQGGVKFQLNPNMLIGVGLDIPLAFHDSTVAYLGVLGRFIYTF
ncbi:MAG TPA: hypothetical protein VGQ83_16855 [Polyangia bacterium]|jgi:opacity protein-like surface antigen